LTEIIDHIESIDEGDADTTEIIAQMLDTIRHHAESKDSSLAVEYPSIDQMARPLGPRQASTRAPCRARD
jgi:hypothetical protein